MNHEQPWWHDAIFYHIHTLGFCGTPAHNDFAAPAEERLLRIAEAAEHIRALGCNAVYLGPLFESSSHGYDTVDHYHVDRRLGNNATLKQLVEELHRRGLRVILDGVFNHVGREHFAFYDLRRRGRDSPYRSWFKELDFGANNRYNDGFTYRAWEGHEELPELELADPGLREHLLGAVRQMVEEFGIDGLRLDVAYALPPDFLRELRRFTTSLQSDFFLLGEIIHGDYPRFLEETELDSATDYALYKALWSSHNDGNYFELAHALERSYGPGENGDTGGDGGPGREAGAAPPLYTFLDNHDVDRIASRLSDPAHLYPLGALLLSLPGIPSIYYGSEYGIEGKKGAHSDAPLRPAWREVSRERPELAAFIAELAELRRRHPALRHGSYRQLHLEHRRFAFERRLAGRHIVTAVNAESRPISLELPVPAGTEAVRDCFHPETLHPVAEGRLLIDLPPYGSAVVQCVARGA
jgi:glycosidase